MSRLRGFLVDAFRSAFHLGPAHREPVTVKLEMLAQILDYPCTTCSGTGRTAGSAGLCPECDGFGYALTPRGAELIEFLGRHGIRVPR